MKFREERGIAYCGMACVLCNYKGYDNCPGCAVNTDDPEDDCWIRKCARTKGIDGCYACPDYPCDKDWPMLQDKRNKAFIRYAREFGKQALIDRLLANYKNGIDHMPDKSPGIYDGLETEDEIYQLLRYGRK